MARIAIGGFQHETNTFAPSLATLAEFETADEWPELTTGPGLPDRVRGMNLPIAGFIEEAEHSGHRLLPTTWGSASPSSYVTEHAYEHIAGLILDGLRAAGCAALRRRVPLPARGDGGRASRRRRGRAAAPGAHPRRSRHPRRRIARLPLQHDTGR